MNDLTKTFYGLLKFPIEDVFSIRNAKNRIKQLGIIIVGATGTGKSTLAKSITKEIYSWYGQVNCNAIYTNTMGLEDFILNAFMNTRSTPVQVLIFDDATGVKVKPQEQRTFFSLRHLMQQATGLTKGIIYTVYITHDWYALDKTFRRNALFTVFLSVPRLDKYSRSAYKKFIGEEALKELTSMSFKTIKYDEHKGKGIIVLPVEENDIGYIYWGDIDFPVTELREIEIEEEY